MTRSWVEVRWAWPSARRQVSTSASAIRCSLVRSSTGTGSSAGWSWWSRRNSSSLTRWSWVRTVRPHSGSSSPAIWVMPSRFFQARSRFLAFIRSHSLRPSSSACSLMNRSRRRLNSKAVSSAPAAEQVAFVLVEGGPGRCVGFGSGLGDGLGVLVGDGAVLEGALRLGQLHRVGGGLGPPFGLARARSSVCGPAGQRCPWPGRRRQRPGQRGLVGSGLRARWSRTEAVR